jgi:hypothetical protein
MALQLVTAELPGGRSYFGNQLFMRIPLILISHSGRSRSPIPVILDHAVHYARGRHGGQHDVALDSYH